MTEQDLHTIESYLHDRLSREEKQAFDERLKSDAEFRAHVGQVRAAIVAVRQVSLDDKLNLLQQEEQKQDAIQPSTFKITPLYRWVAVAAVLLIGLFFLAPLFKPDDTIRNPYLAEHFDDFVLHSTTRGNNSDPKVTPEQERAYNMYRMKQFHKAIPLLEELWEEKRDTLALFYLGVSEKSLGNESKSKIYFEQLHSNPKYTTKIDQLNKK